MQIIPQLLIFPKLLELNLISFSRHPTYISTLQLVDLNQLSIILCTQKHLPYTVCRQPLETEDHVRKYANAIKSSRALQLVVDDNDDDAGEAVWHIINKQNENKSIFKCHLTPYGDSTQLRLGLSSGKVLSQRSLPVLSPPASDSSGLGVGSCHCQLHALKCNDNMKHQQHQKRQQQQ